MYNISLLFLLLVSFDTIVCNQAFNPVTNSRNAFSPSHVNETKIIVESTLGDLGRIQADSWQSKLPSDARIIMEAQVLSGRSDSSPSSPFHSFVKTITLKPHGTETQFNTFTFTSLPTPFENKLPVKFKFLVDKLDYERTKNSYMLMDLVWATFIVDCLLGIYFIWNHIKPAVATIIITLSESTPKELSSKEKEDVRDQLIMGLCPVDQKKLWVKFGNPTYSTEYRFNKLANKITRHEALIADNLHEMAPLQPLFDSKERRDQLRSVLKAYAAYDETLGYCQGMNFIAGCLLEHLYPNEAFGVMVTLLGPNPGSHRLRYLFHPSSYELYESVENLDRLIFTKLPKLYKHMVKENVHPSMYAVRWYRTFFGHSGPRCLLINTINLLLLKGSEILPFCLLAVLKANEDKIKKLDYTELPRFLNKAVFDVFKTDNSFVQDTLCLAEEPSSQGDSKYEVEGSDDGFWSE